MLAYPWSVVLALAITYIAVLLQGIKGRRPFFQNLLGRPLATALLMCLVLLCIVMGITGAHLQHSWPMVLILDMLTLVEGVAMVDDAMHLRHRHPGAFLSHLGAYVFLLTSLCGHADYERATVNVPLDTPSALGMTVDGNAVQLPFTMELKTFTIDTYPPRFCIYNTRSHTVSDEMFTPTTPHGTGKVGTWHITLDTLLTDAMPDTLDAFRPLLHVGATPAAYLRVSNAQGGMAGEGWVCSGSFLFEPMLLPVNDTLSVWMRPAEARQYASTFMLNPQGKSNTPRVLTTQVNHPAQWGAWRIYQTGYDTERGKWSSYSVLECVHDPWSPARQAGLWLLLTGGAAMAVGRRTTYARHGRMIPLTCVLLALAYAAFSLARPQFLGRQLAPALRSVWFIPHVAAYMFAYSLVSIGLIAAIVQTMRGRTLTEPFTAMGWGLLSMGMVMGALWAKQAWGDYWTWDPKETWAAATWAAYLVCLHLPPTVSKKQHLAARIVAFLLLQMTWYGLNLLPTSEGLHTY